MKKENIALIIQTNLDNIPNLENYVTMVSNEDMGVFINKIPSWFSNKMSKFADFFKTSNDNIDRINIDDLGAHGKEIHKKKSIMLKIVKNGNLSKVAAIPVPITLGLRKNLLELSLTVKNHQKFIEILEDSLRETKVELSKLLTSEDYRLATRPKHVNDKYYKTVNEISKIMGEVIDPNGTKDRMKLEEFLPNLSSLNLVYDNLIDVSKKVNLKALEAIKNDVKTISDTTNNLIELLEKNSIKMSKQQFNTMYEYLNLNAKFVTYGTNYIYLTIQTMEMYLKLLEILDDNL